MHNRNLWIGIVVALLLVFPAVADEDSKAAEKRARLDTMADETLSDLVAKNAAAKELFDSAYGHAVFSNIKISLGLTGGGGNGLAVAKGGEPTYMKMGTGGLNLGIGGQKYQVVLLFENENVFQKFVEKGWQADASANASAGTVGANAGTSFKNGLATYQITDKGLMLQADISGTKYWKNKKLN
jgi:lipid-binding SYLF domain-containing protein